MESPTLAILKMAEKLSPEGQAALFDYARLLLESEQETEAPADFPVIAAGSPPPAAAIAAGGSWYEDKMIPKKTKSGTKLYGPYRYLYRWDTGRKKRIFVKYLGKVKQAGPPAVAGQDPAAEAQEGE